MTTANQNLLQAPASGFGQDVSFANSAQQGTPALDGIGRRGVTSAGVIGAPVGGGSPRLDAGAVRMTQVSAPAEDPTFSLLTKVAGEFLQSKIKEERAAAFVTGMQRAASGEAVRDMTEGQPWYTTIFGDSDVVEGARAYTAAAKSAELAGAIEDAMPEVRKLGAEQANAHFKLVADNLTGDTATDATLMQAFARTLPSTMRRQAKEHYAWRQEEASAAESSALLSAADLLQKRAGSDKQTDGEYAQQAVQLIAGMRPAAGRNIESWTKARTNDILTLAQGGKFHAVNAIREAGMLNLLPPEARTKIESALDTAENRVIASKSFEYADEIGAIAGQAEVYSTDLDPKATADQIRALNERFRRETGIDRDLLSLDKAGGIIKDAHVTLLREGERRIREGEAAAKVAATAADKAAAEEKLKSGATAAIALGQAGAAKRADQMGKVVDQQFLAAYRGLAAKGPEAQAKMLALNYTGAGSGDGYVNDAIRDTFVRRVDVAVGGQMPADFLQLHNEYATLKAQNPALADAYFGKHADRMALFDSLLVDGKVGSRNEAAAYAYAFIPQDVPRPKALDKKERAAAQAALAEQHDASDWKFWKQQRTPLRADQIEQATQDMEGLVAKYRSLPGVSMAQATQRAFAERQREAGADMVGGFFIRGARGMQPLTSILRTMRPGDRAIGTGEDAPDVWDKALAGKVEEVAKGMGVSTSDPITILRNDADGRAWLHVGFTASDGRQVYATISSDDIKRYAYEQNPVKQPLKAGEVRGPGGTPLTLGQHIKPGDYDKGAAIVRDQIIADQRKRAAKQQ